MTSQPAPSWISNVYGKSLLIVVGSILLMGCERSASQPSPFRIEACVVEAIQEGPVVLDVSISYNGTNELKNCGFSFPTIEGPKAWRKCNGYMDGEILTSLRDGGTNLELHHLHGGDRTIHRVYLHHNRNYIIDSGKAQIDICCWIEQSKPGLEARFGLLDGMNRIDTLSTILKLDILPADPDNLLALQQRLGQRLAPDTSDAVIQDLANHLYYTHHRVLAPIAWRIIEGSYRSAVDYARLFQVVDESTSEWGEVEARLIRLANNSTYGPRWSLFKYLAERNPAPSGNAFATLTSSDSIWTRVLTYLWFSKRCERLWATDLLARLPELTQPLPQSEFARLLRDLDDDDFRVREQGMTRLIGFGERVESQLKGASHHRLSLEAKRRVRLILERIAVAKEEPEWKPILDYLSSGDCDRDAAVAILRALAKGVPDATLTKAAVASLNKLSVPK